MGLVPCSALALDSDGDSATTASEAEPIRSSRSPRSPRDSPSATVVWTAGDCGSRNCRSPLGSPELTALVVPLPFCEGPGDETPSSSIWNIKSPADCLDLSTGLSAARLVSFVGLAFWDSGEAGVLSTFPALNFSSYGSSWYKRDRSLMESILRCRSCSTSDTSSGYFSKTKSSELRERETG